MHMLIRQTHEEFNKIGINQVKHHNVIIKGTNIELLYKHN